MDYFVLANLTIGILLLVSGGAKLREPAATADAFRALRLPSWLLSLRAPAMLPWFEIALGLLLLFSSGWLLVAAAAAATALMALYLIVIARALRHREPVQCSCFGNLGSGDVSRLTLLRNAVLTVLAALGVTGAALGVSIYSQGSATWGWVAVAFLAAVAVALSIGGGPARPMGGPTGWIRNASLRDAATGSTVRIADLAREHKGVTMLFLLPGCGSCQHVMGQLPELRAAHPGRVIVPVLPEWAAPDAYEGTPLLHRDPGGNIMAALGMTAAPAAVELGPDAVAVGDPVAGSGDVLALLGHVAPEPDEATTPEPAEPEQLDYLRRPIPDAVLLDVHNAPTTLRELAAERPQLLISVDCLCPGPRAALQALPEWQRLLPILDVRPVLQFRPTPGSLTATQEAEALYDHAGLSSRALRMSGQVSAVLLGADGLLAGGPVEGLEEVGAFVRDVAEEIAAASAV